MLLASRADSVDFDGIQRRRQDKKCGVDTHGERAEREPITGYGAEPPAGSRGRAPGQGLSPLKLTTF